MIRRIFRGIPRCFLHGLLAVLSGLVAIVIWLLVPGSALIVFIALRWPWLRKKIEEHWRAKRSAKMAEPGDMLTPCERSAIERQ